MTTVNTNGEALPATPAAPAPAPAAAPAAAPAGASPSLPASAPSNPSSPGNGGASIDASMLSLEDINRVTGKQFKDKESALKALSDTTSFVGKKREDIAAELKQSGEFISKSDLDTEFFYKENAAAASNRKIIDSFAKANGLTARQAAESPELKSLLVKAQGYDASQSAKSVIETNPKLAKVADTTTEVKSLVGSGKKTDAEQLAGKALMEALQ